MESEESQKEKYKHIKDPVPLLKPGEVLRHRASFNRKQTFSIMEWRICYGGLMGKSIEYFLHYREEVNGKVEMDEDRWMHEIQLPIHNNIPFDE